MSTFPQKWTHLHRKEQTAGKARLEPGNIWFDLVVSSYKEMQFLSTTTMVNKRGDIFGNPKIKKAAWIFFFLCSPYSLQAERRKRLPHFQVRKLLAALVPCVFTSHLSFYTCIHTHTHKHYCFDTNPHGELLSSLAITSCHWPSVIYLSECVREQAGWLNVGLKQFSTSKTCQSMLGAPETALCQWGITSEGWHWIRDRKKKTQPCQRLTQPPRARKKKKPGRTAV